MTLCLLDCKPHREDWPFQHHKYNIWLWPVLLGRVNCT